MLTWNRVQLFLNEYGFSTLALALAVIVGVALLWKARRSGWSLLTALTAAAFALLGVGGLTLPGGWAGWALSGAALSLLLMLVVLISTGHWWRPLAWSVAVVALLGLGGVLNGPISDGMLETTRALRGLEFGQPVWLLLLLLIPLTVWFSRRSLAGLGPVRSWVALGLRSLLILFLALALAEPRIRHQTQDMTVLFLVDRSLSIPEEIEVDSKGARVDRRWERIKRFIREAVAQRGPDRKRDRFGVIMFGRRPRLELPPSDAPDLANYNFEISGVIDTNYTDIAAAMKLALASFPENTGKRIVLFSDGNENLGNVEAQARLARENGVQVDVVPLAAGLRNEHEVLVQSVEAPPLVEQGSRLPIRVLVRSHNPNLVVGTLIVKQTSEGRAVDVPGSPRKDTILQPGLNSFTFRQPLSDDNRSYTYEAEFIPEAVQVAQGDKMFLKGLPGDRVQNNRATTHVVSRGQRRILLIEPKEGDHQFLVEQLIAAKKFEVETITVEKLPADKDKFQILLSNYDSVILANVAASDIAAEGEVGAAGSISEIQQEVLRSNTHDQGAGLVMIGGPNGFGAGGWQGTPVEKALPVDCEIKALEIQGKGGLALIMHASEMANGNYWQKQIAKLAIRKLSPSDEVGVLFYDFTTGTVRWHIPMQEIGEKRARLLAMVDTLSPGDMPDFDPALKLAYDALTDPKRELVTKHSIIISDGDPMQNNKQILANMRAKRVTCTTVGVATHGAPQDQALAAIAQATRGRFYNVKSANALPEIYTKETRLVSQSFVYERRFTPKALPIYKLGPTENLPENLDPLYGFVRTTAKASPLVQVAIESPTISGQQFPILAYWHYGLGKSVAFTSDARTKEGKLGWDRDWYRSPMYGKFWEQIIDWSLRPVDSRKLVMTTEQRDGKVRVIIEARDEQGKPMVNLDLRGGVSTPGAKADDPRRMDLKFEQKSSGVYEAEFKAEEAGSYFVTAQAVRQVPLKDKDGNIVKDKEGKPIFNEEGFDNVRGGVTIPYSPEFSDLETNTALLENLRQTTEGVSIADSDAAMREAAAAGLVFRPGLPRFRSLQPVWFWLLMLTAIVLFFDVAVRRIAIEPAAVVEPVQRFWDRLRGRTPAPKQPEFFDRLRSRKAEISESLAKDKAARRFDAGEGGPTIVAPPGADEMRETPKPTTPRPTKQPEPTAEQGEDFASRLMKAKKKAMEGRDRKKDEQ